MRDQKPSDYQINKLPSGDFRVTDLQSNSEQVHKVSKIDFEYNSLIDVALDGNNYKLQFSQMKNDGIKFNFYYKGNNV